MTLNFSVWPAGAVETLQEMACALVEVTGVLGATEIVQLRRLATRTVLRGFSDAEVQECVSEVLVRFADRESSVARRTAVAVGSLERASREFALEMPALGGSVTEGTVTRWLKSVGEHVEADEPLLEVSTDEVDAEVPAPASGTVMAVLVEEDDTVEVGTTLCLISPDSDSSARTSAMNLHRIHAGADALTDMAFQRAGYLPGDAVSLAAGSTVANDIRFGTAFRARLDSAGPRHGSSSDSLHVMSIAMDAVDMTEVGPATAPLLDHRGWSLHGESAVCTELVQRIALSVVDDIPLRHLKIRAYDPDLSGALDVLAELHDTYPDVYPPAAQTLDELRPLLAEAAALAASTGERVTAHRVHTLGELWRAEGRPSNSYVLLVILGYPSGIDVSAQQELIQLAKSAPATGVSLIVHADDSVEPDFGVDPSRLLDELTAFEYRDARWRTGSVPSVVQVMRDRPPSVDDIQVILSDAVERQRQETETGS